jgi:hypothetical protein
MEYQCGMSELFCFVFLNFRKEYFEIKRVYIALLSLNSAVIRSAIFIELARLIASVDAE